MAKKLEKVIVGKEYLKALEAKVTMLDGIFENGELVQILPGDFKMFVLLDKAAIKAARDPDAQPERHVPPPPPPMGARTKKGK